MGNHAVIRKDRLYGTDVAPALVSFKYFVSTTATAIDNGNVVLLDGLMENERELYKGVTPAANSALENIVIVGTNEVNYDERKKNLDDFENAAGVAALGYRPHAGDIFSVTAPALEAAAAIAVGDIVELQAKTKMKVVKSLTANSTKVGEIIAIEKAGRYTYYVIEVK